ncbi:MAG: branched-chain amino acid transport system permease protein livM [Actinomycetota bacterium]|jgi:branched-chain amino acid transport system permease protein
MALTDLRDRVAVPAAVRAAAIAVAVAVGFAVFLQAAFNPPLGTVVNGLATGSLYGLIGVGLILIYRTNRIINFAVAALGAVPGLLGVLLMVVRDWSWWLCFPIAIVGGALVGGLVEVFVIRRFSTAPRLILTVATIGVSQILAYFGFLLGLGLGTEGDPQPAPITPFTKLWSVSISGQRFSMDYAFGVFMVLVCVLALTLFLRYTRIGIALRASAENADRAALLGIPVRRVQTVAWVLAGTLAGLVIFIRSTIVGVPADGALGYEVLLFALTAAVIARMDSIPVCLAAGMGIGALAESSLVRTGSSALATGIMLGVILVALLAQRNRMSRAMDTGVSTWQAVREFRPIPLELRGTKEVVVLRTVLAVAVGGFLLAIPFIVPEARIGDVQTIVIASIVAVSLVILSGWAGQISLGQFGLVGVGAAVAGRMAVSWNADFFLILAAAALAGAVASVLIGLPALRLPGLYLAVTTLALGAAMQNFFLNRSYVVGRELLPPQGDRIVAPCLWDNRVCLGDGVVPTRGYYYLCLTVLGLALLMARAYRRNRAGRAVVAVRENVRAASSYSVHPARTKLGAFAVSGALAAVAGVLVAFQSGSIDSSTYGIEPSVRIFVTVVIGGLTSLGGAVFGTMVLEGIRLFGEDAIKNLSLLVTGPGLLLVLMLLPGGFAEGLYRMRDSVLRWIAKRNGIEVPSLVADRLIETGEDQAEIIEAAEEHVEQVDAFDHLEKEPVP